MDIRIREFVKGARESEGVTVIIDVFRAFSVACYAFDNGIKRIIDVATPEEARALKKLIKAETILVGEQNEKKPDGFDFGNSPTEMITASLAGKSMIHTTTAGTNGILNAVGASEILGASIVNAAAVARYIRIVKPAKVSLVAMGYRAKESAEEDLLCAEYIKELLEGRERDITADLAALRHGSGKRFFEPENLSFSPPTDFFLCTDLNRFNFILKAVVTDAGHAEIVRVDMNN